MKHFIPAAIGSLSYNAYMMLNSPEDTTKYAYAFGCVLGIVIVGVVMSLLLDTKEKSNGTLGKS